MTAKPASSTRTRVERGIYVRHDKAGRKVYVVGYRDSDGRQRWQTVAAGSPRRAPSATRSRAPAARGEQVRPNPRLRFGEAADAWLAEQVVRAAPARRRRSTAPRRDAPAAALGRPADGRDQTARRRPAGARAARAGPAEWTIAGILKAAARVFKFAARHLDWHGENPVGGWRRASGRGRGGARAAIFQGDELAQTLAAATSPTGRCSTWPRSPAPARASCSGSRGRTWTWPTRRRRRSVQRFSSTSTAGGWS